MATVAILRDGSYLKPDRKAQRATAGDVVEVLGGWYAASLVADGFAAYAVAGLVTGFEPEAPAALDPSVATPARKGRARSSRS